jgi:hypothetical protein
MQIINQIIKLIPNSKQQKMLVLKNIDNDLYDKILELTRYLSDETNLTTRMKFIDGNYNSLIKCRVCNIDHQRLDDKGKISLYCSGDCYKVDPNKNKDSWKKVDQKSKMEKLRATNKEKYGHEYNSQRSDIKTILQKNMLDRYEKTSFKYLNNYDWLYEQYITNRLTTLEIANSIGVIRETVSKALDRHNIIIRHYVNRSAMEREVEEYIKSLINEDEIITSHMINNYELDIFIPKFNFSIEMNGLYWHSEIDGTNKFKMKHYKKFVSSKDYNIQLFQFTDEMWSEKQDICKSMILNKFNMCQKIYARKCKILDISYNEYKDFCNNNHISGFSSATVKLGLYHNDKLVEIMSFNKPRFNRDYEWEIIRLATLKNNIVIGGASKLFKHFIRTYNPSSILSYSDNQFGWGNVYDKLGFSNIGFTEIGYKWTDRYKTYNRMQFQKHKLKEKLKIFDEKLSERDNMINNGYRYYWDCGNTKWEYKKPPEI